ncbi:MAG: sugar ABC transporter substrate-binding protein [Sphaerochaetaceae bacterium]|nr:sugar ABC transporter substrate-binding protein [Sphaerochaetaceae bacterium]
MKKTFVFIMVLVMMVSMVYAQGGKESEPEVQTVKFWYHFDDPETALNPLIEKFEAENPGIVIEPERISWDVYNQKLLTAIAGGYPPDVAQVKLWWQPQLVEMGALLPLDDYIASWDGKDDIYDKVWELTKYSDGHQYYMPLQMVILYLYYRTDMFEQLGLELPKTREEFLDVAKKLTRDTDGDGIVDVYGFGIRGARGGHDWWGTFVLSSGAQFFDEDGNSGLTTDKAIAANQWFIDLYRKHKVSPPTTPSDGFKEIIANMVSGKTAMTIHHLGSAKTLEEALGDKISAAPVPMGTEGAWTSFGDEENAVFAATEVPDAAFKWVSFLAEAENNAIWQKSSGQVSINKSNATSDADRFLKATTDSADFAGVLPAHSGTAEFVESLWPALMQQAFAGQITSEQMMQQIEDHFSE